MNNFVRNTLGLLAGIILGSLVNMSLINISGSIIAPPVGADVTTTEGLQAAIHLFEPKHFLFPFLAHALGTFAGSFVAAYTAATYKMTFAYIVGVLFLAGGIAAVFMLPSPLWYTLTDLILAYIPFAYMGGKLGSKKRGQ